MEQETIIPISLSWSKHPQHHDEHFCTIKSQSLRACLWRVVGDGLLVGDVDGPAEAAREDAPRAPRSMETDGRPRRHTPQPLRNASSPTSRTTTVHDKSRGWMDGSKWTEKTGLTHEETGLAVYPKKSRHRDDDTSTLPPTPSGRTELD
jgi:hypothetical protein